MGDYVIVVNAEKVMVTGKKASQKLHLRIPERIVEKAVKGMLPKNSYGRDLFRHLKVFKGPVHEHESQQPEPLTFSGLTVEPDSMVLVLEDPDDPTCANMLAQ